MYVINHIIVNSVFLLWHNDQAIKNRVPDYGNLTKIVGPRTSDSLSSKSIHKNDDCHDPSCAIGYQVDCKRLHEWEGLSLGH